MKCENEMKDIFCVIFKIKLYKNLIIDDRKIREKEKKFLFLIFTHRQKIRNVQKIYIYLVLYVLYVIF